MNINLYTWFCDRQLEFCPRHFIKCNASLNEEAKFWVYENLKGRFYIKELSVLSLLSEQEQEIYFEDPQEATLYELRWS